MQPRPDRPNRNHRVAGVDAMHLKIEADLRAAGRRLELLGVDDPEAARLARVVFRLAQRAAVDGGRLESAA